MGITHSKILRFSAASLCAGIGCLALASPSYADTLPTFTDDNGTVWAYQIDTSGETPVLSIGFKSAANTTNTELSVPSLADVKTKIGDSSISNLDTYFVRELITGTDANASVAPNLTKLDMSNTAKSQIVSLKPLFKNTTGEVELKFGADMVIADAGQNTNAPGLFQDLKVKLNGLEKVKYIGWNAFKNTTLNEENRNITIYQPQTVGGYVFYGSNVKSLTLNTPEIGEGFCENCTDLTSLTFGGGARKVYGNAFRGTTALKQVLSTNKLTDIGRQAFESSAITGITFGNDLEIIREEVFMNTNLGSLSLGDEFTARIGNYAFMNANLSTVDLGNSVTRIGDWAFYNNNITTLSIPKSVTVLGVAAFGKNPLDTLTTNFDMTLLAADYNPDSKYYDENSQWDVSGATLRVFLGCASGQWVSCPSDGSADAGVHLKHLIVNAPYGSSETAPSHDYSYNNDNHGELLRAYRRNAKNIIPAHFFADLDSLESVEIGEGFEMIDSCAFMRGYSNHLGDNNYNPGYGTSPVRLEGKRYVLTTISFPSTLKAIGDKAFMWFSNNRNFKINELPQNLEFIGDQAFWMNAGTIKDLKSRVIKYIGFQAFYAGINVEKIYLGPSLTSIGNTAFGGNRGYMDLTIDTDINSMLNGTFRMTFGLWVGGDYSGYLSNPIVNAPDGFVNMPANGGNVMNYERHYKSIVFTERAIAEPQNSNMFMEGLYCDYVDFSATPWQTLPANTLQFTKIEELKLPSGLKTIESNALLGAQIEEPLVLPSGLQEIGSSAFMADSMGRIVGDVTIDSLPTTITKIGENAFFKQEKVAVDVTSQNITEIGNAAFYGTSVRDVVMGSNLTKIGNNIFHSVPTLRNITIDMNLYDPAINTGIQYYIDHPEYYSGEDIVRASYPTFVNTFGTGENRFGRLTFTANAKTACHNDNVDCDNVNTVTPCKDDADNDMDCNRKYAYFYGINASKLDISATGWQVTPSMFQGATIGELKLPTGLTTIGEDAFYQATINKVALPETIETLEPEAFQWAKGKITNALPSGIKYIKRSAFYGADMTDDLVIPAGVRELGESAFHAGDEDVYYDTVTLEGDLTYAITTNQPIFVLFYNAKIHTLIVNGATTPTLTANDGIPEFNAMTMEEVVITDLPTIPANAFEQNENLKMVVLQRDAALREIGPEAFIDCEKLYVIKFSSDLADKTVTIGKNAFNNTGFETIGGDDAQFKLTAANFDASAGYAFVNMKNLKSVHVPANFSNATIPAGTFANAPELTTVTIDPAIDTVEDAAFANDNKLDSLIFWGDTIIHDSSLSGYVAPTRGAVNTITGLTIPEGTNIYAYTNSPAEEYATHEGRASFDGKFYPLDEVLYIATEKTRVTQDSTDDLDTGNVKVYALRRDGIVLESDDWGQLNDTYPRSEKNIKFTDMNATIESDPAFGTVFDTPIDADALDYSNENFANISYTVTPTSDDSGNSLATIAYTDGYTGHEATTPVLIRSARRAAATAPAAATGGSGSETGTGSETGSGSTSGTGSTSGSGSETGTGSTSGSGSETGTGSTSGSGSETGTSSTGSTSSTTGGSSSSTGAGSNSGSNSSSSSSSTGAGSNSGSNSSSSSSNGSGESTGSGNANSNSESTGSENAGSGESASSESAASNNTTGATDGATSAANTNAKKSAGSDNPKTDDKILGYVAMLGSFTLFATAIAMIYFHKKN